MESSRFRVSQSVEQEYDEATSSHRRLVVRFSQRRRWNRSRHDSPFRECRYGLMFFWRQAFQVMLSKELGRRPSLVSRRIGTYCATSAASGLTMF